jgi:hypothetical protein
VRQVIYRHKDFPKNFHPLGDREFLVSAAAKNLEKSLRKRVCPFANHGTLPLHGELSGQEADRISQKIRSQKKEVCCVQQEKSWRYKKRIQEVW